MGTPSPCPYCSAPRRAGGGGRHDAVADALQDLNRQVALIRKMAEESSRQEREIRRQAAYLGGFLPRERLAEPPYLLGSVSSTRAVLPIPADRCQISPVSRPESRLAGGHPAGAWS